MGKIFLARDTQPFMYDSDDRSLWLMEGDLFVEVACLNSIARIRTYCREISQEEAVVLAHTEQ